MWDVDPLTFGAQPAIAAPWTPASVATAFWYKADTGVYIDAGVTPATNGQAVQQWNDQSGNGRHLTNRLAGSTPTYTTGALNSLPGLLFHNNNSTTTNSQLQTAAFSLAQPFTVVMVFKNTAGAATTPGGMATFAILLDGDRDQVAASRIIVFGGRSDAPTVNDATYFAGTGVGKDAGVTFAASTAYHYGVIYDDTTAGSSSDINGTTSSAATGTNGTGGITNGISIGSVISTVNAIDCYMCELFCIPSTTDLANALGYVLAKWGV